MTIERAAERSGSVSDPFGGRPPDPVVGLPIHLGVNVWIAAFLAIERRSMLAC
jgi:hypothetical protein